MAKKNKQTKEKPAPISMNMAFTKDNYRWMVIGFAVIVLGFILMVGKTDDIFNNSEVLRTGEKSFSSTVKVTIAPIVVLLGFAIEVFAIFKGSKSIQTNEPD